MQRELFPIEAQNDASDTEGNRIVIVVETKIGAFGNRTDLIVVDEGTVRGASLIECDDPNVEYYNYAS